MTIKRWSKAEFVNRAILKFENKFSYDKVFYKNARESIIVTCKVHGDFNTQPYSFLKSKVACPKCSSELVGISRIKSQSTKFIDKSEKQFKGKFDYSKVEYKGKDTPVTLICKDHGEFSITPLSHFALDNGGCSGCLKDYQSKTRRSNTEEFIQKASKVHDGKYDYSTTNYKSSKDKLDIICRLHGVFTQRASKHLEGAGCPECSDKGFVATKPSILYILKSGDFVKVGISNHDVSKRIERLNKRSGLIFEVYRVYRFSDGVKCSDIETDILRYLRSKYDNPLRKFEGYSETFISVDLQDLIDRLNKLGVNYG